MSKQRFYSLKEWKEYINTFMSGVSIFVSERMVAITEDGEELGEWKGKGFGTINERRSIKRLTK